MTGDESIPGVLTLRRPYGPDVPLVLDSPHSGCRYPPDFGTVVPLRALRRSEDMHVEALFGDAPEVGATLLAAEFPRAYIDPNRSLSDVDPSLMDEPWPGPVAPGEKARLGHGLIWRLCPPDLPMYARRLSAAEVTARIDGYWRPYHRTLGATLDRLHRRFGQVWLVNCHSMPAVTAPGAAPAAGRAGADFVLGDRDHSTCDVDFTQFVRQVLREMGYRVRVNDPYKGVEIVRAHSDPAAGRHALQIEINRGLYMDETSYERSDGFEALRRNMALLTRHIADYVQARTFDMAAE